MCSLFAGKFQLTNVGGKKNRNSPLDKYYNSLTVKNTLWMLKLEGKSMKRNRTFGSS